MQTATANTSSVDQHFMQRCLELAARGSYAASPNPMVGCVIVSNGELVAEGWHRQAGGPHAEINALEQAGSKAANAVLYVSLEPCCHSGKTGPCTDAIIAAGITEVVYGLQDPNPVVAGKGIAQLEQAGLRVRGPVLEQQCAVLNNGFISRIHRGRPYLCCKLAMSLDGRTAMASGESKWITGESARQDVQVCRAQSDVIITGLGTLLADDPQLNVRLDDFPFVQPLRVVVDSQLQVDPDLQLFRTEGRILLACALTDEELSTRRQPFEKLTNVEIRSFPGAAGSKVNLAALLEYLGTDKQCNYAWLESGAALAGVMLRQGLVDELVCYVAPRLMGSEARPLLELAGISKMSDSLALEFLQVEMVGKDCKMRCLVENSGARGAD